MNTKYRKIKQKITLPILNSNKLFVCTCSEMYKTVMTA